jgi:hypothetical protein
MFTCGNALGKTIYCMIEGKDWLDGCKINTGNYAVETHPMSTIEDTMRYVGTVWKKGRLFVWRDPNY